MSRFETIGPELDLTELAKHNRNFDRADADLTSQQQQISAEQQARMAADSAHAGSEAAHPAEHITYSGPVAGAGNVKQAIDAQDARINNIVASAGSSNTEIVDARPGLDGVTHPVLKDRFDRMEQRQLSAQNQTTTISRGVNVINSDQASGATFKVRGCTLCNIIGRDGGCESLAPFAAAGGGLSEISSFDGIKSIKFTSIAGNPRTAYKDYNYTLDQSKQYFFGAWAFVESYTSGNAQIGLRDYGASTSRYGANINTSIVGQKQFVFFKVPTANALVGNGFRMQFGINTGGDMVVHFGAIRLYEVTAAEYVAIGTTITGEAIDRRWPYVDGVQHTQGLSVRKTGKNAFPGGITAVSGTGASAVNLDSETIEVISGSAAPSYAVLERIPVVPNTNYIISYNATIVSGADAPMLRIRRGGGSSWHQIDGAGDKSLTFNSGTETSILLYAYASNTVASVQVKRYSNIQIEIGTTKTEYERYNPQYAHVPVKLPSNVDRTIADSYDSATGQVFRRWMTDIKLDNSFQWGFAEDYTGFKRISANILLFSGRNIISNLTKYDGRIIKWINLVSSTDWTSGDQFQLGANDGAIRMTVSDSDSGWTDSLHPNTNAVKALINGWKANGNNGTVYNSWVSSLTGVVPATNTEAYVATNKAPGWDAYATLDYVRATPVIEQLTGDLGALSVVKGGNSVELLEGMIVREKFIPKLDTTTYYVQSAGESAFWGTSRVSMRTRQFINVYQKKEGITVRDDRWSFSSDRVWASTNSTRYAPGEVESSEWYVDYFVLDKQLYTPNAVDATLTYQSTQGSVIAQNVQDIAAIKTHDGVQDWILAQYAARLLALEEA